VITATAENIAALKGTATSTVTYFPQAVRDRFSIEGGAAVFGAFQYGLPGAFIWVQHLLRRNTFSCR